MKKSRLQGVLRFSIFAVVFIIVFVSVVFLINQSITELVSLFTTGITTICVMTSALIGRYGAREAVLSSQAGNSKEVREMITKGMEEK